MLGKQTILAIMIESCMTPESYKEAASSSFLGSSFDMTRAAEASNPRRAIFAQLSVRENRVGPVHAFVKQEAIRRFYSFATITSTSSPAP